MYSPIISSQWLFENLNNQDLVILDASVKKVTSNNENSENIRIKGARFFDLKNNFSDKDSDLPNTFPSVAQFEQECQNLGVNIGSLIVVYDNLGIYSSPRVWWMLKIMGHKNVTVLNGGLPDWVSAGYPVEKITLKEVYDKGNFRANLSINSVKDFHFIKTNTHKKESLVIDARSKGRFSGKAPEPREGLKSGSIPNSYNIPFGDVLENGKFKSKEDLKTIFSKIKTENKELIYSCGSGLTACIILLAGELILPNKTAVYDGSWTEWSQIEK